MNCKICEEETDVQLVVNLSDVAICEKCARQIFRHVALAVADNKTVFDIHRRLERKPIEVHPEIAAEVLNYLHKDLLKSKTIPKYTPDTVPQSYLDFVSARVNDGATKEELLAVCYFKFKEWGNDPERKQWIRASTLFRRRNFNKYLAEHGHKIPKMKAVTSGKQREIIKELNSYGVKAIVNDETDRLAKELMSTGYDNKAFLNMYLKEKI